MSSHKFQLQFIISHVFPLECIIYDEIIINSGELLSISAVRSFPRPAMDRASNQLCDVSSIWAILLTGRRQAGRTGKVADVGDKGVANTSSRLPAADSTAPASRPTQVQMLH